jgi:hypothetical protein
MKYPEDGFTILKSPEVLDKVEEINLLLCELLKIEFKSESFLEDVHSRFREMFTDRETYFGFLKGFTNHPITQEISACRELLDAVRKCGVSAPTLVTPPILHVVSADLIVNQAKVFTPPHQDVVSTRGSVGQVVIWIPLHDVDEDNFGISALTGSHKRGMLDIDPSEFGHTVKKELLENSKFEYIKLEKGESVIFSQYLVHHTHQIGKFRMALSFRFNDMNDEEWKNRKYFVPFDRVSKNESYADSRELAPTSPFEYFANLK